MTQAVTAAVLGAGSWGTALALQLCRNQHRVTLWGHHPPHISSLQRDRCNGRYLPQIPFPASLQLSHDLARAVHQAELVLVVVPSHAFAMLLQQLKTHLKAQTGLAWASKGLEHNSGRLLHQVCDEQLGTEQPLAVVSGPSFAGEVAMGLPTAITVASPDSDYAHWLASLLHSNNMLAYTSTDMIGVELGGAVKNVLAIATGIADGLGFGANARAAVITRGLAELVRLGLAVGGQRETFMGLTGVGDLVLTCTDDQSRNRRFGLAIGRGQNVAQAQAEIAQVVEGANTVCEIMRLARHHDIDMPICEQVEQVLHHGRVPRDAVEILLSRPPRPEAD